MGKRKNKTQLQRFFDRNASLYKVQNQSQEQNQEDQIQPQQNNQNQSNNQQIIPQIPQEQTNLAKQTSYNLKEYLEQSITDKQIFCRENELEQIRIFLKQPAQIYPFLYICGEVGMGKTKSVKKILQETNKIEKCLWINGYAYIVRIRQEKAFIGGLIKDWLPQNVRQHKQIVVVDEFDKVSQKKQLLEQIHKNNIKAILICNEYNLQIQKQIQIPFKILLFQPYDSKQLAQIAHKKFNKQRLVIKSEALTYLAKKLCNQSSDFRKLQKILKTLIVEKQLPICLSDVISSSESHTINKFLQRQINQLNQIQKQILKTIITQNQHLQKMKQKYPDQFKTRKLRFNSIHSALGLYNIKKNALIDQLIQFQNLSFIHIGQTFQEIHPTPNEEICLLLDNTKQILKLL